MAIKSFLFTACFFLAVAFSPVAHTEELDVRKILQEVESLKQRILQLEQQLANAAVQTDSSQGTVAQHNLVQENPVQESLVQESLVHKNVSQKNTPEFSKPTSQAPELSVETSVAQTEPVKAEKPEGIKVGGAVRFQYSNERYNQGNRERSGDFDFDTFRLNLDGEVGDVILSAEWRWFQYMNVVHHAWAGYNLNDESQIQIGIHKVPFGVLPFNSHNFFFSSNYYVGLEDDYDTGIKYLYNKGPWDVRLAFYLNDEQGGVDGFVDQREDRYSYDVLGVRSAGEGLFDTPAFELAENNTLNGRLAYTFDLGDEFDIELGFSAQNGDLDGGNGSVGSHDAYAAHMVGNYKQWNLQLQASTYEYDLDMGADLLAVGAYSFYDTIPAQADTYTANLAYDLPVNLGPITNLTFYNDYSVITNKSASLEDTWMNVLGVAVTSGGLYTYFDYITARNQPFINGSVAGDGGTEKRFNINFGYYF